VENTEQVDPPDELATQSETDAPMETAVEQFTESPETSPDETNSLMDRIRNEHGLDLSTKYATDEDALKGLVNASQMVGKKDQDAELGRYYRDHADSFQQYIEMKDEVEQQPELEASQQEWWNPPDWDSSWNQYVTQQDGEGVLVENTPREIKQKIQARQNYLSHWASELTTNPQQALGPLKDQIKQEVMEEVRQQNAAANQQHQMWSEAQQMMQNNSEWMWEKNANGDPIYDSAGQRMTTPSGTSYSKHLVDLVNGKHSQQHVFNELARLWTKSEIGEMSKPAASAATATATATIDRRTSGSPNGRKVKSRSGLSLKDKMMADVSHIPDSEFKM
jgi:hypothetical protein